MKKRVGTLFTLTYKKQSESDMDYFLEFVAKVRNNIKCGTDLKISTSTSYSKTGRMHHHILINKEINEDVLYGWKNGLAKIDYIDEEDYFKAVRYMIC